jgi:hypothetical protein
VAGADAVSLHQAFRRQPVDQGMAQALVAVTLPAPTRGLVESENYTFMAPGGAVVMDNWFPTMRGAKLRGGCIRWNDLHGLDAPLWQNAYAYNILGAMAFDASSITFWKVAVTHTSAAAPTTFAQDRIAHPTYWVQTDVATRLPVISSFEYASGNVQHMFAANATKLFDVTASPPTLVQSGQASGNYCASQLANQGGDFLIAVNDAGDFPLRYDGTTWTQLSADQINGPAGSTVQHGRNLVYAWKYRSRWFFIEGGSMNVWYLPTNAIQGTLALIPLSGAAAKGGKLLFGAAWTIDAGDGLDDKCVFMTDQGEALIFTGTDPSDSANWRQEGRYQVPKPMGMNAHVLLGGDLLIATVDGVVPLSAAITKDAGQLQLAMLTLTIRTTWRAEVLAKSALPWTMERWDEYGGMFVTWPGGPVGDRYCAVVNTATGAWCRFVGYDATCFIRLRGDMFFGTQDGRIMQADRTGYDDGVPYVCSLVGGWEMFQSPSQTAVWHQARASFTAGSLEPFKPQIAACTDYVIALPQPPNPGPDPGVLDVWDQGLWDEALWDQPSVGAPSVQNTMWVSVGATGFSHAPVVQVMVAQSAKPNVELISIAATFEKLGVNV